MGAFQLVKLTKKRNTPPLILNYLYEIFYSVEFKIITHINNLGTAIVRKRKKVLRTSLHYIRLSRSSCRGTKIPISISEVFNFFYDYTAILFLEFVGGCQRCFAFNFFSSLLNSGKYFHPLEHIIIFSDKYKNFSVAMSFKRRRSKALLDFLSVIFVKHLNAFQPTSSLGLFWGRGSFLFLLIYDTFIRHNFCWV